MKYSEPNGFSLVELLVAMAIASIVMAAVVSAFTVQVRNKNTQEAVTDMTSSARAAMEIMISELSAAGCDPTDADVAGIVAAAANDLTFSMDIGNTAGTTFRPDGLIDGPNEQVQYAVTAGGDLGRATGAGVLQPLASNVDALDFVYLDANGVVTATLADIRSIQITIVARAGRAAPGYMGRTVDNTAYTNQQGTVVFTAPGDSFMRLLLTTTVNCRNLGI